MKRIVLFASGSGTNVENIIQYFSENKQVEIVAVLTNRKDAKVLDRCARLKISALYFNRRAFMETDLISDFLNNLNLDLIVLAGFLWRIPKRLIDYFPDRIINIHPALLPKYGGKGMYGMRVHEAVKENSEPETGITIHYVNEHYDEGAIIMQVKTFVDAADTPEIIAQKVHELEYEHYPRVIEELLFKG